MIGIYPLCYSDTTPKIMFALNKFKTLPHWLNKWVNSVPNVGLLKQIATTCDAANGAEISHFTFNSLIHFLLDFPAKISIVIQSDNTR